MRDRVLLLLRRYGRTTTSFQALEPGLSYWFDGDDAVVAYAPARGAWIAATEPLCPPQRRREVCQRFVAAARENGRRACFFAVGDEFADLGYDTMPVGLEAIFAPSEWPSILKRRRSLREQLRRARAKDVVVEVVDGATLADKPEPLRSQIEALADHWRATRKMAPMSFLVELDVFGSMTERRYFVARRHGELVAVLVAVPIYAGDGWLLEDLLREPDAPNGTSELLFDAAMTHFDQRGCATVSYGLAPLAESPSRWLRRIAAAGRFLYKFEGVYNFKKKLEPCEWRQANLAYPKGGSAVRHTIDTLRAFAGGSFVRFGLATLIHRAPAVVWWLALLLIPWTIALTSAPVSWFPSTGIKWLWVGFDVALFGGLVALATRFRRGLAVVLSLAAALDLALGIAQLALHNLALSPTPMHWVAITLALAAPLGASVYLMAARHWPRLPPLKNRE